jgi:hypothetical protein
MASTETRPVGPADAALDRSLRALDRSAATREQYILSVGQMYDYFALRSPALSGKVMRIILANGQATVTVRST